MFRGGQPGRGEKGLPVGARGAQAGIPGGLVDHQDMARGRHRRGRVEGGVFRQMLALHLGDGGLGPGQQRGIVQRRPGAEPFQIGHRGRVEMHPAAVEAEAEARPAPGAAGQDRAQEGILDGQDRRAAAGRHGMAPPCRGRLAPDPHQGARGTRGAGPRQADPQPVPRQGQDAADPALGQEAAVIDVKRGAPGMRRGGLVSCRCHRRCSPARPRS